MKTYQYYEWTDCNDNRSELATFEDAKSLKNQGVIPTHAMLCLSMRKRSLEDAKTEVKLFIQRRAEQLFLKAEEQAVALELSGAPTQ